MRKYEFLNELEKLLYFMDQREKNDILNDYSVHFDNELTNGKTERQIAIELGSPQEIANQYRDTINDSGLNSRGNNYDPYSRYDNYNPNGKASRPIPPPHASYNRQNGNRNANRNNYDDHFDDRTSNKNEYDDQYENNNYEKSENQPREAEKKSGGGIVGHIFAVIGWLLLCAVAVPLFLGLGVGALGLFVGFITHTVMAFWIFENTMLAIAACLVCAGGTVLTYYAAKYLFIFCLKLAKRLFIAIGATFKRLFAA